MITWSKTDKTATNTLSNDSLTAKVVGDIYSYVRATDGKGTGVGYYEVTFDGYTTSSSALIGISNSSATYNTTDTILYGQNGTIYKDGVSISSKAPYTVGDVIRIEIDADLKNVSFFKNGEFQLKVNYSFSKAYPFLSISAPQASRTFTVTANFSALNRISRIFILKDNEYYFYGLTEWESLGNNPTIEQIMSNGMNEITADQITLFESIHGNYWSPVHWTDGTPLNTGILKVTPFNQVLTAKNSIELKGVDSATFKWIASGEARVAMSVDDGVTYHALKNKIWVDVSNDISNAMTASEYTSLTWEQFKLLKGNSNFLKHQYYIPDNSKVDDILIIAELVGSNKIADASDYSVNYDQLNKQIKIRINKSSTYFVNYIDG